MKSRPNILSHQKDSCRSAEFIGVLTMHKFTWRVISNLDFKVTIIFNVRYLENGTTYGCNYNGRVIGTRMWFVKWWHFQCCWLTSNPDFKSIRRCISQKRYQIDTGFLQTTNRKLYVCYWIVPLPMTLICLQGHFGYFSLKLKCSQLFRSLTQNPGDLMKVDIANDLEWPLKIIPDVINRFRCLYVKLTAHTVY